MEFLHQQQKQSKNQDQHRHNLLLHRLLLPLHYNKKTKIPQDSRVI